jgi:hypothetical protein
VRAPEDVLFERHFLDRAQAGLVVPGEMGVRLGHSGHERGARAVDGVDARSRKRAGATADLEDAVALDQHLAAEGLRAGAVEDADVGEEYVAHRFSLSHLLTRGGRLRIGLSPMIFTWAHRET